MFRFYRRTSANRGYSNGLFVEGLRYAFWGFLILIVPAGFIGLILSGDIGYLPLVIAMAIGAWIGWHRH